MTAPEATSTAAPSVAATGVPPSATSARAGDRRPARTPVRRFGTPDALSGLMFIVVGIGFAVGAQDYAFGSSARPGPGYFPFGLGLLLAGLGVAVLAIALRRPGPGLGRVAWKPLLTIVGSVVLFGVLLPVAGMLIALPLLVVLSSMGGDEFRWRAALINAVVLTAFCWFVFNWGLNLTIPLLPTFVGAAG